MTLRNIKATRFLENSTLFQQNLLAYSLQAYSRLTFCMAYGNSLYTYRMKSDKVGYNEG